MIEASLIVPARMRPSERVARGGRRPVVQDKLHPLLPPPPTGWEAGWTGGEPEEEEEGATKKGPSAVIYYELDVCHLT